ncbi:cytochrome-c peroxidase [Sphingobacterium hungaricum]|uniref:Cytochrome-c peroxidase n=1 Tax=Sphingobacterium hungaricum TaxID=2082723 RepID=A0A928UVJ5_9SPHI|nr:cytochrome c peroxidase [Sphingobacterium hungaricum]MBE8714010.1 cytochrome-c peroxidase [Sphingobacterium hungaricum]
MKKIIVFLSLLFLVWACKKADEVLPDTFLGFVRPSNFPEPQYDLSRNGITQAGFELGKRLFYEGRLSRNNTISCGSCHIQSAAFTHHGHDVSHGIDDRLGTRNPQPIMNMAWDKEFFWEGGVFDLDLAAVRAITSEVEMDETVPNVLLKLRAHPEYPSLFEKAFGTPEITDERFFKALSQFMLMAISDQSKYDKVMRNESGFAFSDEEKAGYLFFQNKCSSCHSEPFFKDKIYRNNGLKPSVINDLGRYEITLNPLDKYKFKVPSLRNWQYTSPYMHDGRFLTIERVLEHYRNGMVDSETLDPIFRNPDGSIGIAMTDAEVANLIAFLKTLNDKEFVTNPLLSEPTIGSSTTIN